MISVKFECLHDDDGVMYRSPLTLKAVFSDDIKLDSANRKLLAMYEACRIFNLGMKECEAEEC